MNRFNLFEPDDIKILIQLFLCNKSFIIQNFIFYLDNVNDERIKICLNRKTEFIRTDDNRKQNISTSK